MARVYCLDPSHQHYLFSTSSPKSYILLVPQQERPFCCHLQIGVGDSIHWRDTICQWKMSGGQYWGGGGGGDNTIHSDIGKLIQSSWNNTNKIINHPHTLCLSYDIIRQDCVNCHASQLRMTSYYILWWLKGTRHYSSWEITPGSDCGTVWLGLVVGRVIQVVTGCVGGIWCDSDILILNSIIWVSCCCWAIKEYVLIIWHY